MFYGYPTPCQRHDSQNQLSPVDLQSAEWVSPEVPRQRIADGFEF